MPDAGKDISPTGHLLAPMLVGLGVGAMALTRVSSPDLGFHLATGREVLLSGEIPATNVLSFTASDHPWLLHEWCFGVIAELMWSTAGPASLVVVKALVIALSWLLCYGAARKLGAGAWPAALVVISAAAVASERFVIRPQIITSLFVAALLWGLAWLQHNTPTRRQQIIGLSLISAGVAINYQLHAGAIFMVLCVCGAVSGIWIEPLRARLTGTEALMPADRASGLGLVAAVAAGVAVAALALVIYHPHGLRLLIVPFMLGNNAYLNEHVIEYRASWEFSVLHLAHFWVWSLLVVGVLVHRVKKTHAGWLVLAAAFLVLSIRHIRVVFLFALISAPLVALSLTDLEKRLRHTRARILVPLGIAAALVLGPLHRWSQSPPGFEPEPRRWPIEMFESMRTAGIAGPAYLSDGWAGPYLAVFYPDERVFFDPRFEAYPEGFVEGVYQHIRYGKPGWDKMLDEHGVEVILIKYTTAAEARFQQGAPNLRQHLASDARWTLVSFDDYGALFVRSKGRYEAQAAELAIPGVDPDKCRFIGPPEAAAPGLVRALSRGPESVRLAVVAALALHKDGQGQRARQILEAAHAHAPEDPLVIQARALVR